MTSELLAFSKERLNRFRDGYAAAKESGELSFQFDVYDFLVDYAEHRIDDLEDHFEKAKKTKQVYRFSGDSM